MMKLELIRMGIVYVHLLACCIAIGTVFMSDLQLVKDLAGGRGNVDPSHLRGLHRTLVWALGVLWLTGLTMIGSDVVLKGAQTLLNPKLQAKIAVVVLLTVDGMMLDRHVLPALQRAGSLLLLRPREQSLALLAGAVSAVSWLYAALLGVGRPLSWKYSLVEILAGWPLLVACGFMGMALMVAWARRQHEVLPRRVRVAR